MVFGDRDEMVSYDLPVMVRNTLKNKDYWMPDIDEVVLCVFLPIGLEAGFIMGGFYTKPVPRPATTGAKRVVEFEDGTRAEYDRATHTLLADVKGAAEIKTTGNLTAEVGQALEATVTTTASLTAGASVTITAPAIQLNGPVTIAGPLALSGGGAGDGAQITGDVTVTGDVTAGGTSLRQHTHDGVTPGDGSTGGPQ